MKPMTKAVAVALVQILLICSLGAKLLYDRRSCPQAWFKTRRYDPNLPIRGRYLTMQLELKDSRSPQEVESKFKDEIKAQENLRKQNSSFWRGPIDFGHECGSIAVRDGVAVAVFDASPYVANCDNLSFTRQRQESGTETTLRLNEPVLFFLPDTAADPGHLRAGEELWVLATIPRKGPPRPITLGVKGAGESAIRPLKVD
jgi:hypothetical protein